MSEAQKRGYVLADNQIAWQPGWDDALLAEELTWLHDERFDLDLIGFDAMELERLLALAEGEAASDEAEDKVPAPPEDPVTRPGNLWILGNHRVLWTTLRVAPKDPSPQPWPISQRILDTTRSILKRRSGIWLRGVPVRRLLQHPERHQRGGVRMHEQLGATHSAAGVRSRGRQVVDVRDLGEQHLYARPADYQPARRRGAKRG